LNHQWRKLQKKSQKRSKFVKKLIEKKVSEILQKRQRDGRDEVIGTRKSAEEEAKKSLRSFWSRRRCSISLFMNNAASTVWKWTGIGEKKGWDFLQLAITASIPVVIFIGTQYYSRENNKQQQEIATDRYRQEALTKYFEQMSQLLLDKNLRKEESEARTIARARTLSTLGELDRDRKKLLIKFLAEAKLVSREKPVISLVNADLSGVDFSRINLVGAFLSGVDLSRADLSGAYLVGVKLIVADLSEADLSGADLVEAKLIIADLSEANLSGVFLHRADLHRANLSGANLHRADLSGANLDGAKNLSNQQIKSACFWEKAIYTGTEWNRREKRWILVDEKANQNKIEEIRQDKTSDPKDPPNCDRWLSQSPLPSIN
jgi:uncharacterized protein YjbI with pentapeptide repeats